jgi:alkylated DNA repair protein (DNA oxidative demethylase)
MSSSLRELSSTVLTQFFNWKDFCPETALINFYDSSSSMGLHVDKDEEDHESPVVGLSFGSTCRFFFENEEGDITDIQIPGNSLYIFGRQARLMRHGVGTIYTKTLSPGSDAYLKNKERLSITIRQVYH